MVKVRGEVCLLLVLLSTVPACYRKMSDRPQPQSGSVVTTRKGEASTDGFEQAKRDVATLKKRLASKSPEELIGSLIADTPHGYGGYVYYYGYMANHSIREELRSRGSTASAALQRHRHDQKRLLEAVNGPG